MAINFLLLILSFIVLWRANLPSLISTFTKSNTALHLFLGSVLSVVLLAWIQGGLDSQMPLHFLGLSATTLILGKRFAILACGLSTAILTIVGKISLNDAGATLLFGMLIPVMVLSCWNNRSTTTSMWRFVIQVAGIAAILTFATKSLLMSGYYYLHYHIPATHIFSNYLSMSVLFWLPEIMLNATEILTLLQHRPHWVASFHTNKNDDV